MDSLPPGRIKVNAKADCRTVFDLRQARMLRAPASVGSACSSTPMRPSTQVSPQVRPRVLAAAQRRQQQTSKRRKQRPSKDGQGPPGMDDLDDYELVTNTGAPVLPRAPSPSVDERKRMQEEEPPYPVFAPKPSSVKKSSSWSWTEDGEEIKEDASLPAWNPKTGFMRSAAAAPLPSPQLPSSLQGINDPRDAASPGPATPTTTQPINEPAAEPHISLLTPASGQDLPAVTKSQVLTSCIGTGFWMTVLAFFLRAYAQVNAPMVLGTDEQQLLQYLSLPSGLDSWNNVGVLLGCAGVVTGARMALKEVWPEFRDATDRSNKQILTPLSWADILLVACISGFSEEILFRGAIIPATFLDWRGVLLSATIFGLLHNSGGRNLAFAAWATGVGCLYGAAFITTQNIWVPAAAHTLANFSSAALWKSSNRSST